MTINGDERSMHVIKASVEYLFSVDTKSIHQLVTLSRFISHLGNQLC